MTTKRKIPMRKCVGCGEMKPKKELMRVLRTEENEFVLDTTGKKNGRGAYLCMSKDCFEKAVKSKGLERSFKQAIPTEVYDRLEKQMSELETRKDIVTDRNCKKGWKMREWRIYDRTRNKVRSCHTCDRSRRFI